MDENRADITTFKGTDEAYYALRACLPQPQPLRCSPPLLQPLFRYFSRKVALVPHSRPVAARRGSAGFTQPFDEIYGPPDLLTTSRVEIT